MATARNVFVKSKMNKDLDDRLIGKGEYRDAQNVNISRSEGDDVGAIENVLGNELLHAFTLPGNRGMEAIGVFEDITNNLIYIFATDYTDTSDNSLDNFAPYNAKCGIFSYNLKTNANKTLVQGRFLNFSKRSLIGGVNLIEDLLFFTDNRNQPRKINVKKAAASSTHYTTEDQISVTKYAPYQAPRLYNTFSVTPTSGSGAGPYVVSSADHEKLRAGQYIKASPTFINGSIPYIIASTNSTAKSFTLNQVAPSSKFPVNQPIEIYETGSKNVIQEFTSPTIWADFANATSTQIIVSNPSGEIKTNMLISNETIQSKITVATVSSQSTSTAVFTITPNTASIRAEISSSGSGGKLLFSDPNSQYISSFPGDEEYLSDKFVRFSYRFKFEDGEHSLIAPFTQPAFVPKQSGYLVDEENTNNDVKDVLRYGATNKIVESTILAFFENSVNRVDVNIPTPFAVNQLADKLKISEIDILYNESDALAVRVLDTIPITDSSITGNSTNIYTYNYNSEKPFRTLPEPDVVRVFDVCPVRAKTQSVSGNRVIYGNFLDKHTPPENLNYNTRLDRKSNSKQNESSYAEIAYPYHSVKQNRTYQVGVILSDRYGRSTDVILSSLSNVQYTLNSQIYGGDTIYAPYRKSPQPNTNDPSSAVQKWFGDSLKILFRDVIPESITYADGYPGVYKSGEYTVEVANNLPAGNELIVTSIAREIEVGNVLIDGSGAAHTITSIDYSNLKLGLQPDIPQTTSGQVFNVYGPSNPLGFYSYKIVIQQPAADYYNAYLGNVVMGEFRGAKNSADVLIQGNFRNTVSYTSLIGSNINKIPANTTNLQPEQTLFSTADEKLFPRVNSTFDGNDESTDKPKQQFIGKKFCTGSIIGKLIDLGIRDTSPSDPPRIKEGADLVDSITFQASPSAYDAQVKQNVKPIASQLPGATAPTTPVNDSIRVTITTTGSAGNALVTKVEVTNPGSGYVVGETLTFSGEDFGGGTSGSPVGNNMVLRIRQSDTDIQESGVGFFQAQQNPTAVKIINPNVRIGNPSAGTRDVDATGNDSLFNVFEIKSPESNLEIFYETSTSGLVSEINTAVLGGTSAQPVVPDPPADEI